MKTESEREGGGSIDGSIGRVKYLPNTFLQSEKFRKEVGHRGGGYIESEGLGICK